MHNLSRQSVPADIIATRCAELAISANYIFVRREPIIRSERAFHRGEATGNDNDPERCEVSPGCRGDSGRSCLLSGGESRDVEAPVYYGPGESGGGWADGDRWVYTPSARAAYSDAPQTAIIYIKFNATT